MVNAGEQPAAQPRLRHVATLHIEVGPPIEIGATPAGLRRVIPITGGRVAGALFEGRILPGGADFQLIRTPSETEVEARYVIETDRGETVYVDNRGLRTGSPEDIARLREDLPVDPSRIYFRSSPRFETSALRLADLTRHVFVGVGIRRPDTVQFDVFQVD